MTELRSKRRLRALSITVAAIVGVLVWRLVDIQIVNHRQYVEQAKQHQIEHKLIPARRGHIFDRNGFPLAVTRWSYDVGVTPAHFPIEKKKAVACLAEACALTQKELRRRLTGNRSSHYVLLGRDLHLTDNQVSTLSSLAGVRLDPNHDRLYPFESLPPQLVGAIDGSGKGIAGIESGFQGVLGGLDGWVLESRISGTRRGYKPVNAPGRKALAGADLQLTIDTRVQAIVDFELAQAVDRYRAAGGIAIVADPATGDILAIAEKPDRRFSRDRRIADGFALRSINCIYEPGSTFKLITHSYLIETKKARPQDTFFGDNGTSVFDWGTIRDDHPYGWLTLKQTFVHSSNICTIKAAQGTDREDFYRYILRFGFAGRTGIDLPAESRGTVREPASWSMRSLPSIAIGHEIGVTPLQMIMSYCALANGGVLMAPRIALGARTASGDVVKRVPPVTIRRVFSEETARTMIDFCRGVVIEGTGVKAAVDGIAVAGKTGTSQKIENGIYRHDKFVTSFVGFAPAEAPRLACLVVLDEPASPFWWGSTSAAVVFGKIIEGIHLSTDMLSSENVSTVALPRERSKKTRVPSFLRLSAAEAADLAAKSGIVLDCPNLPGVVYSQTPDPGTFIGRSDRVSLLVRPERPAGETQAAVPDVAGLSLREARCMLLGRGFDCAVRGHGVVARQEPAAGKTLRPGGTVVIHCAPRPGNRAISSAAAAIGAGT
jgi:cell division protein FtsI/penicillin-binding protein 2